MRVLYGTVVLIEFAFPEATSVFAFGEFDVSNEMPTGFVVVQLRVTSQLLWPAAMLHEGDVGVSVPDIVDAWHVLPFQVVPDAQLDVAVRVTSSWPLLYRKKVRVL